MKNFENSDNFKELLEESDSENDKIMELAMLPESIFNFNNNNITAFLSGGGYFYEQNDLIKRINAFGDKKFKKRFDYYCC